MKIDVYCHSVTISPDEPTMMSGCAYKLVMTNGTERYEQSMSFALGSSSHERAVMMMLRLSLSSIIPKYRSGQVIIHCVHDLAYKMLLKIGAKYQYDYDLDNIVELRRVADTYKSLYITCASDEKREYVAQLAYNAAAKQVETDTGIVYVNN